MKKLGAVLGILLSAAGCLGFILLFIFNYEGAGHIEPRVWFSAMACVGIALLGRFLVRISNRKLFDRLFSSKERPSKAVTIIGIIGMVCFAIVYHVFWFR